MFRQLNAYGCPVILAAPLIWRVPMFKRIVLAIALMASLSCQAAVEINQATEAELDGVKGLGPSSTDMNQFRKSVGSGAT